MAYPQRTTIYPITLLTKKV